MATKQYDPLEALDYDDEQRLDAALDLLVAIVLDAPADKRTALLAALDACSDNVEFAFMADYWSLYEALADLAAQLERAAT